MPIRTTLIAALAMGAAAFAQGPGPGRMGRFGGEAGGPPMGGRLVGAVAGMPGRVVKSAPYSADVVTETSQTLADGNHVHQVNTAKVYRDSEGRVRTEQSLGGLLGVNSSQRQVVFINDPVAGVNYALNVNDKTASKSAWARGGRGPQASASARAQGQNATPPNGGRWGQRSAQAPAGTGRGGRAGSLARQNVKTESLGRQTIEGVVADGTRTTTTIPAGQMGNDAPIQIVSERWYSAELQTEVMTKHSDPRFGETVYRLANVSRAEPASTLFQPPADYKVSEARGGRGPRPAAAQ
jgi:hypothetical protein